MLESEADETILLGALVSITNPDPEMIDRIKPDHLSGVRATIWQTARSLRTAGTTITPRNIASRHPDNQALHKALEDVSGRVWPAGRVAEAEQTVIELGKLRRLQGALVAAQERITSGTYSAALEAAHAELARLDESTTGSEVREFSDVWDQWQDSIQSPDDPSATAIPTPWWGLDEKLAGGLHRGRTYVVGGRPGEGKSIAGVNLATHAAEQGYSTVVFSVEMGEHEVASRIIASGAQAEYGQITKRKIDAHNWQRIGEWGDTNRSMPLRIVDKTDIGVEYVSAVCRTIHRTQGLDVVFVDYLQLLKPGGSKIPRERQIADMSRGLKVLSQELGCAVVVACQLNRNSANENRAPALSDLRESGSIEQDCDVAILLHHLQDGSGEPTGNLELIVAKNRTGTIGPVSARWKAYQARIEA